MPASAEGNGEDINRALRREIILCTAWGITDSIQAGRRCSNPERRDDKPTRKRIHLPHSYLVNKVFDFVTYCPSQFAELRSICAQDAGEYLGSFTAPGQSDEMVERFTEGRSGSFFYFTHDQKYLVKTVTSGDKATLLAYLTEYRSHLQRFPQSLLPRFLGLYAIRLSPEQRYIHFVVMQNVFAAAGSPLRRDLVFDLKGSRIKRRVVPQHASIYSVSGVTLKDLDLRETITMGDVAKSAVQSQLTVDVSFLNSHNIMDYSLLLGIFRCTDAATLSRFHRGSASAEDAATETAVEARLLDGIASSKKPMAGDERGSVVYFGGLIDVLQRYSWSKVLENTSKRALLCQDGHGISCVEPDEYALRFLQAMGQHMR